MGCDAKDIGVENLQLIDFSEEDDYLIAFPFRDSLEDLRLSVTFDNVKENEGFRLFGSENSGEMVNQSESLEPRRPSFLRKSLAWDTAFFSSAGVLDPEELFLINKGFKKTESCHLSPGIRRDGQLHRAAVMNTNGSSSEPCIHKLSRRSKVASNIVGPGFQKANTPSSMKMSTFSQNNVKSARASKSQSPNPQGSESVTKKSIGPEIIQDAVRSQGSYLQSPRPPTPLSRAKLISNRKIKMPSLEGADKDKVKMENKTRKAGSGLELTASKRSRWGDLSGLPKSTSATKNDSKVSCSYESSSSAKSSKSLRRKISPRNTKLAASNSSIPFSLTSTCSSSSSPASSRWSSESLSSTSTINEEPAISLHPRGTCLIDYGMQASDLQNRSQAPCFSPFQKVKETKSTSQCVRRASAGTSRFLGGPKTNIKSSGLRMPSPKIGFFDEEQSLQPMRKGNVQFRFGGQSPLSHENRLNRDQPCNLSPSMVTENGLKVGKLFSGEHDKRKAGVSASRLNPDAQRTKMMSTNKTDIDRKRQKGDTGSFQGEAIINPCKKKHEETDQCSLQGNGKENVFSFEDQMNGLSQSFEVIDLDRDGAVEVKGKLSREQSKPSLFPYPATAEPTTPCSRTPLAEKSFC